MSNLLRQDGGVSERMPAIAPTPALAAIDSPLGGSSLIQVLWHWRWTVAGCVTACLLLASAYLALATPIYRSSAKVYIEPNSAKVYSEAAGPIAQSENYLNSQAEILRSAPVLVRALESVDYHSLKSFADARGDVVADLQRGSALKVEVVKRCDIIEVSMDSPWPNDASSIVQAVVDAYLWQRSHERESAGEITVATLQQERDELETKRQTCLQKMAQMKSETGVLSFKDDKGNTQLERTAVLNNQHTTAEVLIWDLKARVNAAEDAIKSPQAIAAFVESQQFKGKDMGDREFDELRTELVQSSMALATSLKVQGANSQRAQTLGAMVDSLKARIAEKERSIAQAYLSELRVQLAAAQQQEQQLRDALAGQQKKSQDVGATALQYLKLESEAERLGKQGDVLDSRIAEVHVNSGPGPLNARSMGPPQLDEKPVSPRKSLVLATAALFGALLGMGISLLRESRGARLRSPDEIITLLGVPVMAMVPRINPRFSPVARGQVVYLDPRSSVAEAYRTVRTSLNLGAAQEARTLLIASPATGDGKSTTASNLAIAFAEAGQRTLIVDCDLREPVQHLIFGTDAAVGLSNVMVGEVALNEAILPTRVPNLFLLPCGPVPANPAEMLASKRFAHLMQALLGDFDRIVLDSPPVMHVTDARILAASADATLLVVRINHSIRKLGILAMDGLERVRANVVGAIANDMPSTRRAYYGGSWQYAARSRHLLPSQAARSVESAAALSQLDAVNGNGNGNGAASAADPASLAAPRTGKPVIAAQMAGFLDEDAPGAAEQTDADYLVGEVGSDEKENIS